MSQAHSRGLFTAISCFTIRFLSNTSKGEPRQGGCRKPVCSSLLKAPGVFTRCPQGPAVARSIPRTLAIKLHLPCLRPLAVDSQPCVGSRECPPYFIPCAVCCTGRAASCRAHLRGHGHGRRPLQFVQPHLCKTGLALYSGEHLSLLRGCVSFPCAFEARAVAICHGLPSAP
jgi:hypothetical protein